MRRKQENPENKRNFIHVRMDDEEYDQFLELVGHTGMTMSDYIRSMVLTGSVNVTIRPVLNSEKLDQIVYQSAMIGNNINQIAKHLNEGNPMTARLSKNLNHELIELQKMRNAIEDLAEGK